MALKWHEEIIKAAKEVMIRGGRLEFIVYKRQGNKRKPVILKYIDNEINCDEEEIVD